MTKIIYQGDGMPHEHKLPWDAYNEPEINQIVQCDCGKFFVYRRTRDPVWTEKGCWRGIYWWNFRAKRRIRESGLTF